MLPCVSTPSRIEFTAPVMMILNRSFVPRFAVVFDFNGEHHFLTVDRHLPGETYLIAREPRKPP